MSKADDWNRTAAAVELTQSNNYLAVGSNETLHDAVDNDDHDGGDPGGNGDDDDYDDGDIRDDGDVGDNC